MRYHYTSLGAVPALAKRSVERRDEMLARTGPAARSLMVWARRLPPSERVLALNRVLADFEPGLPMRVQRVAEFLHREGMGTEDAVERALALSLADASIEKIKRLGQAYQGGATLHAEQLGRWLGCVGCAGLGQTTTTPPATPTDPGAVVGAMFQGIICSDGLKTAVTDAVGRNEGRSAADATTIGFSVGQGMAMCPPGTAPAPVPDPGPVREERSLALPIAIGVGAIALVGGVAWFTMRKR